MLTSPFVGRTRLQPASSRSGFFVFFIWFSSTISLSQLNFNLNLDLCNQGTRLRRYCDKNLFIMLHVAFSRGYLLMSDATFIYLFHQSSGTKPQQIRPLGRWKLSSCSSWLRFSIKATYFLCIIITLVFFTHSAVLGNLHQPQNGITPVNSCHLDPLACR